MTHPHPHLIKSSLVKFFFSGGAFFDNKFNTADSRFRTGCKRKSRSARPRRRSKTCWRLACSRRSRRPSRRSWRSGRRSTITSRRRWRGWCRSSPETWPGVNMMQLLHYLSFMLRQNEQLLFVFGLASLFRLYIWGRRLEAPTVRV